MRSNSYLLFVTVSLIMATCTYSQTKKECHSNEFKCKEGGKCIPYLYRCDGTTRDCDDGSDEQYCPEGCGHSTFYCKFSRKCVQNAKRCDGIDDCGLNEDEIGCKNQACKPGQFRCQTAIPECVPMTSVCDRKRQCTDGSDEYKAACDSVGRTFQRICEEYSFHCKAEDLCIDQEFVCDGNPDCQDKSDENCNHKNNMTKVIQVPDKVECKNGYFQCNDGTCITKDRTCDGKADCKRNEDENNCLFQCDKNQLRCPNEKKCFNLTQKCNGVFDCKDKSDELNCTSETTSTVKTTPSTTELPTTTTAGKKCDSKLYFDCDGTGKQCVPWSKVCDKRNDCTINGGADETNVNCSRNSCNINNGGCSHKCSFDILQKVRTCSCPAGYQLDKNDKRTCIDIDECKQWDRCSHYCENLNGSFNCECPAGYFKPNENSTSCTVTGEKALMFSSQKDVREYKFYFNELRSVAHGLKNIVGFDIDQTKRPRVIYWSATSGDIGQMVLSSTGPRRKVLVSDKNSVLDGLMIDWTNDLLYWTDTGLDRIGVMNLTSGQRTVLLEGKPWLDEPRAIILDPESGFLYWSDWSTDEPRISRMGMNGENITVLLDKKFVRHPNALALDSESRRLYYGDAKLGKIGCFDLNTGIHRDIIVDKKIYPFSMIVFEERIYWSDWRKNAVLSANKFTGKDISVVASTLKPMTLRMINPSVQRRMQGRCNNNKCSHLCLPSAEIDLYTCACPVDMKLAEDKRRCIKSKTYRPRHSTKKGEQNQRNPMKPDVVFVEKSTDVGFIAGITIGVIVTVSLVALIMGIVLYERYSRRIRTRTIHFDNGGLIKTTEDLSLFRSNSSMRSMKTVPSSSQPLWSYQTNNDLVEEMMVGNEIKV